MFLFAKAMAKRDLNLYQRPFGDLGLAQHFSLNTPHCGGRGIDCENDIG